MKLLIINGSVRQGRVNTRVVKWVEKAARKELPDVEVEVADLKEIDLPRFDEPVSPMMNHDRKPEGNLKRWLDLLASADGFVVVTSEYNHSMPGALKDAIDFIDHQVTRKPFQVVGHGGVGGARAIEQVKLALNAKIGAIPMPFNVNVIGFIGYENSINEDGDANTDFVHKLAGPLKDALINLEWYAKVLKEAREHEPTS